ncbi:hypothetical protein [Methylocystis echinoides]|jgi:hypothetical protein|uniref:hypothetical protein n=1 Tax=Methylocystis echinoides TaxID=29468 RepID=UPI003448E14B
MFIQSSKIESTLWFRIAVPLVAGALVAAALSANAQAAPETFLVPDDGYGVTECLKGKSDCGRIVADAWCEAHGHGPAQAYGRADDVTAAIPAAASRPSQQTDAMVIACAD